MEKIRLQKNSWKNPSSQGINGQKDPKENKSKRYFFSLFSLFVSFYFIKQSKAKQNKANPNKTKSNITKQNETNQTKYRKQNPAKYKTLTIDQ